MMTKNERIALLRELCLEFGPTGCEDVVAKLIRKKLDELGYSHTTDRMGNIVVHIPSPGKKKLMVSAHMDEVGMIINDITEEGYLKFSPLGGIDPRVLCSKHVTVEGHDGKYVKGVIASKAIHHQTPEERSTATPVKSMYIDIGVTSKDAAKELTAVANSATFDSEFVVFGENEGFIKSKAIDDRLGCADMLYALDLIRRKELPVDLYFCFTVREEIGLSGARTAAQWIEPDYAVVLESTAVADLPDVPESRRVAELGKGGALSLRDRSTVYDRGFINFTVALAEKQGIAVQYKKYVSGGNDAGHIHKSGKGVACLALSAPSRYIHSPACVVSMDDYLSMGELLYVIIENFDSEEIENA